MNDPKICPLLSIAAEMKGTPPECQGARCALWNEKTQYIEGKYYTTDKGCALLKIAEKLDDLSDAIYGGLSHD